MHAKYIDFFQRKNGKFYPKYYDIFNTIAQNINCGYLLECPQPGASNVYPQSMFWIKNYKDGIPLYTPVLLIKVGFKGFYILLICFPDDRCKYTLFTLSWMFFLLKVGPKKINPPPPPTIKSNGGSLTWQKISQTSSSLFFDAFFLSVSIVWS